MLSWPRVRTDKFMRIHFLTNGNWMQTVFSVQLVIVKLTCKKSKCPSESPLNEKKDYLLFQAFSFTLNHHPEQVDVLGNNNKPISGFTDLATLPQNYCDTSLLMIKLFTSSVTRWQHKQLDHYLNMKYVAFLWDLVQLTNHSQVVYFSGCEQQLFKV